MGKVTQLSWCGASRSGSRKERNDDSWIVFSANASGSEVLSGTGKGTIDEQDLVFAVSDGMGGGNAGDLASALILKRMAEMIPDTFKAAASGFFPDSISHLGDTVKAVHADIVEASMEEKDRKGMAATLALAWFSPDNLYIGNVGDSRIYRCRGGKTEQLSKDHVVVWGQLKRGEISEVEYRTHPRRAALYEVVGGGRTNLNPHLAAVSYQAGDRFLVCSDGLIDGLWERHISDGLATSVSPEECCGKLMQRGISNSCVDDTTLIIIDVSES